MNHSRNLTVCWTTLLVAVKRTWTRIAWTVKTTILIISWRESAVFIVVERCCVGRIVARCNNVVIEHWGYTNHRRQHLQLIISIHRRICSSIIVTANQFKSALKPELLTSVVFYNIRVKSNAETSRTEMT